MASKAFGVTVAIIGMLTIVSIAYFSGMLNIAPPTVEMKNASVSMHDNYFDPANLVISINTNVTWTNMGVDMHTTTSDNGLWDSGILQHGQSFSHAFNSTGTFQYYCEVHLESMVGTITVVS